MASSTDVFIHYLTPNIITEIDNYMSIKKERRLESIRYWYNFTNQKYRLYGPSKVRFYRQSAQISSKEWFKNNKMYRRTAPSVIWYRYNGQVEEERWYDADSLFHRLDAPALIGYGKNGLIDIQEYYVHGAPHRLNGPAKICRDDMGNIRRYEWHQDGRYYNYNNLACFVEYDCIGNITLARRVDRYEKSMTISAITDADILDQIKNLVI